MTRQIRFWPAVALMVVALAVGLLTGGALGAFAGYTYGTNQPASPLASAAGPTPAATETPPSVTPSTEQAPVSTQSVNEIVAEVNPAVVTIVNQVGRRGAAGGGGTGIGTGMIIDEAGHIVTNNHVVDGAGSLAVIFSDGTRVPATLIGGDPYQDVAVIKVAEPVPATVSFGDSSQVEPGEPVIAIGSALGEFRNTVTNGIVSGAGRSLDTGQGYRLENLIQHDAPINPGNSGGPLVDMRGNVIGMNTAVVRGGFGQPEAQGLGFAVESNTVKAFAEQLIADGRIERPYLGISFRPIASAGASRADAQPAPVLVVTVVPDSPADAAGIQVGDVITAVGGTTLDSDHPFINVMYQHAPGDTVTVTVERNDGAPQELRVTLGTPPAS